MTGKDLIIYILQNNLEDAPVISDGRFIGFMTVDEAAVKFDVGKATIEAWFQLNLIKGVQLGGELYIPANVEDPRFKGDNYEKSNKNTNSGGVIEFILNNNQYL